MTDHLEAGTVVADRFTVVRELGRGGMAVVYEVEHHQLGTSCALKVLTMAGRSVRDRLTLEGKVQSAVKHPNILTVFDVVDVDGSPGLLLELVRGPALDRLLAETRLTWDQCDALATGILSGMQAAHEAGLIHRDLKPANILCAVAGGQLVPKVADFGLAKVLDDGVDHASRTRSGTTMGTPSYMAPEQVRNAGKVDARADVFSLGAVLYEICTGVRAFDGDDLLAIYLAIANGTFRPPRELAPDLPERMERAIRGALEPDRDKRIQDAATLLAVWRGDRDEWTAERGVDAPTHGPWDAAFLRRYQASSRSGERSFRSNSPAPKNATFTSSASLPPMAAPPARSAGPRWSAAVGAVALLGALGLGLGSAAGVAAMVGLTAVSGASGEREAEGVAEAPLTPSPGPEPAPEPVAAVPVPVEPAAGPPPAPGPTASPGPSPAGRAKAKAAPEPAAEAPAPDPAPAPEPAPVADGRFQVSLTGDNDRVYLIGADGSRVRLPARVPPGTYQIQIFLDAARPTAAGSLSVTRDTTLTCMNAMGKCR